MSNVTQTSFGCSYTNGENSFDDYVMLTRAQTAATTDAAFCVLMMFTF